jgi:hypothetical protein
MIIEREKNSLAAGIPNSSGDDGKEPLTMSRRMAPKQMTKEERARRERLMREYGYDLEDVVEGANGETEIVYKDRSKKATGMAINHSIITLLLIKSKPV